MSENSKTEKAGYLKTLGLALTMAVVPGTSFSAPKGKTVRKTNNTETVMPQKVVVDPLLYAKPVSGPNQAYYNDVLDHIVYDKYIFNNTDGEHSLDSPEFYCMVGHEIDHNVSKIATTINKKNLSAYQISVVAWAEEARAFFQDNIIQMNTWAETVSDENPQGNIDLLPQQIPELRKMISDGKFTVSEWTGKSNDTQMKIVGMLVENAINHALNVDYGEEYFGEATEVFNADKTLQDGASTKENIFDKNIEEVLNVKFSDLNMYYDNKTQKIVVMPSQSTNLYGYFRDYIENKLLSSEVMTKTFSKIASDAQKIINFNKEKEAKPIQYTGIMAGFNRNLHAIHEKVKKLGRNPYTNRSAELKELNDAWAHYHKVSKDDAMRLSPEQMQKIVKYSQYPDCVSKNMSHEKQDTKFVLNDTAKAYQASIAKVKAHIENTQAKELSIQLTKHDEAKPLLSPEFIRSITSKNNKIFS